MKKKMTIEALAAQMQKGFAKLDAKISRIDERMEIGFASIACDIADIKHDMATTDQLIAVQTQVNSIEQQLRKSRHEERIADLEEEVFGDARHPML